MDNKKNYAAIKKISETERKEILEYALQRSEEILSGKDEHQCSTPSEIPSGDYSLV